MNNLILVIGTADSFDSINPKLISTRGKSTFTTKLTIPELSKTDRCEIIYHMICEKAPGSEKLISKLDFDSYATRTDGYVIKDLIQFIFKALFEAWQRKALIGGPLTIITSDLETAIGASTPFSLQGLNVNKGSKITFADIGGLQDAKEKLTKIILWPIEFPEIIDQCPLKQQNSALLYGVPGTGKTLLANAVAGESGLNFISIKGPELMSKYIGESEEAVRRLFEKAQAAKPCLLFFDEFDSLAPRRGKDQTGVTDRVVNQLLTALDGVESLTGVWVIAATSRPDLIDPALLRPGRIGTSVFCDLPSKSDRVEILQHLCANVCLADDVILDEIAGRTEMYTGADLKGLISTAQIKLLDNLGINFNFMILK
ncbi:hypothetical protein AAG570_001401 [Ranatra chinensis]|uniref:AAA+ ATPase domain-containing protein n=1 Tax=Ranatra chinensis TaxID=642074 RepID=A0ABD0YBS7_9HEMI